MEIGLAHSLRIDCQCDGITKELLVFLGRLGQQLSSFFFAYFDLTVQQFEISFTAVT